MIQKKNLPIEPARNYKNKPGPLLLTLTFAVSLVTLMSSSPKEAEAARNVYWKIFLEIRNNRVSAPKPNRTSPPAPATKEAPAPVRNSPSVPETPAIAATPESTTRSQLVPSVYPSKFAGKAFYAAPWNDAARTADMKASSDPDGAAALRRMSSEPVAAWFGGWNFDPANDARAYVSSARAAGSLPVIVLYDIPDRDCGGYSSGGAMGSDGYISWIREIASGIGESPVVIVLEPDALASMNCLSESGKEKRYGLLKEAVSILKTNPNAYVYIDAGHPAWIPASDMAERLKSAGISSADGFSLNVSNFRGNSENIAYGEAVSGNTGGAHFVIDTSRNGNGSNGAWCNPEGMALGRRPTTDTGHPLVDAFLWIKVPGQSDGNCNGGPNAGVWWPEYAIGLAKRSSYLSI